MIAPLSAIAGWGLGWVLGFPLAMSGPLLPAVRLSSWLAIRRPGLARAAVAHEQPVVDPQVSHFMQVPLRSNVKLPHSPHASPW